MHKILIYEILFYLLCKHRPYGAVDTKDRENLLNKLQKEMSN
jgi:hypothetical protein